MGYWSFDGTGSIANNQTTGLRDESGRGNHGTASNANAVGMAFVPGRVGNAVTFDGVDDFVDAGNHPSLNLTSVGTISVWVRTHRNFPSDSAGMTHRGIISKTIGGGGGQQSFYLEWPGTNTTRNLRAEIGNATGVQGFWISNFDFRTSWRNIVYTWNGSHHNLYIDGSFQGQTAQTINAQISAAPLRIGVVFGLFAFWDGLIDEVRIYNRALTEAEIRANFNATR